MSSNQPASEYFGLLSRHINPTEYELFACGKDAPTRETVEQFATEFTAVLPEDLIQFTTSSLGGLYVAVKEELWPRPKEFEVGPFWTFLYGFWTFGFGRQIPPFMDIRAQTTEFRERSQTHLTPCLQIAGDADLYCFDSDGAVCRWDHELNEHRPRGKTFLETLELELSELASRKAKHAAMNDNAPLK